MSADESTAPAAPPRYRVAAVGWDTTHRVALLNELGLLSRAGAEVLLVCVDRAQWAPVPPRFGVLDLAAEERTAGLNRLARLGPAGLGAGVSGLAAATFLHGRARLAGLAVAAATWVGAAAAPENALERRWLGSHVYADLRGWTLWRAARRHLDVIDPASLDEVLLRDVECWPLAWQLLQRNPGIRVAASYDRTAVAAFSAVREAWLLQTKAGRREVRSGRLRTRAMGLARSPVGRLARKALPAGLGARARRWAHA